MKDVEKIKLTIPFLPCSVNQAYAGGSRRHKSDEYVDFQDKMEVFFMNPDNGFEIDGENFLEFHYKLYIPIYNKDGSVRKIDVANYEKTLVDTLAEHIKGFDDKYIKRICGEKIDSDRNEIEFEIWEI